MKRIPNPNANKFKIPEGFRDIGWQLTLSNPDFAQCLASGHTQKSGQITEFDNSLFLNRCTDVIRICSECKIVSHTDMSD